MIYTVVLILTLLNGDIVQKKGVTAHSMQECGQIIEAWAKEMREEHDKASTFITGCVKKE